MPPRIPVSPSCATRCRTCEACDDSKAPLTARQALSLAEGAHEIVLGGGDVTRWTELTAFLEATPAARVWLEAPARSLSPAAVEALAARGLHGLVIQAEPSAEALGMLLDRSRGVLTSTAAAGLDARVRLCAGPETFAMVAPVARALAPRVVTLELSRRGRGGRLIRMRPRAVEHAFVQAPNLTFEHHRLNGRGYLPPCALPRLWDTRRSVWGTVLASEGGRPNRALPCCAECSLSSRCRFAETEALGPSTRAALSPISGRPEGAKRSRRRAIPDRIAKLRTGPEITCIAPWTMMEMVDPVGLVNHCCGDWTVGSRGSARVRSLEELWNGPNYRSARRRMLGDDTGPLCRSICPRLHDRRFAEHDLQIVERSGPFEENQLLLAEDLALRRDVVRAKPLFMVLCPTTYCNYDCIMCSYGRMPRRDLPDSVLEQVESYLPTLRTLTLLGGEPLASKAVMELLRRFDRDKYPDGGVDLVTNGSLLTPRALESLGGCAFGAVVVSLNAGTPEVYERIHGGARMGPVLENIDALLAHRERFGPYGVTLSFVVQPLSSPTLVEFGRIAAERDLDIRLLPLTPSSRDLDYYGCPRTVARVLEDIQAFADWASSRRPSWLTEIESTRKAILQEAARRGNRREAAA